MKSDLVNDFGDSNKDCCEKFDFSFFIEGLVDVLNRDRHGEVREGNMIFLGKIVVKIVDSSPRVYKGSVQDVFSKGVLKQVYGKMKSFRFLIC